MWLPLDEDEEDTVQQSSSSSSSSLVFLVIVLFPELAGAGSILVCGWMFARCSISWWAS